MLRTIFAFISLSLLPSVALAQEAVPPRNMVLDFLPFVVIILIFYFLLIRPQQQRQKSHTQMIEGLKKHDEIISQSGLKGKITKVADNELTVEIAEGVRVKMVKSMVLEVINPKPANDS